MRHLIFFCATVALALPAQAAQKTPAPSSAVAVKAMKEYCMPPIQEKSDPATFIVEKGLKEFNAEQARKFSPEGGRVFEIPAASGNAVLITNTVHGFTCAVAVHKLKASTFWNVLDSEMTGFSLMREKRVEEDRLTKKEYGFETLGGTLTLLVTASDVPRQNGLQGLMTLAIVKK